LLEVEARNHGWLNAQMKTLPPHFSCSWSCLQNYYNSGLKYGIAQQGAIKSKDEIRID
jgi:hypothetical protein